jgi:hypothetical protein
MPAALPPALPVMIAADHQGHPALPAAFAVLYARTRTLLAGPVRRAFPSVSPRLVPFLDRYNPGLVSALTRNPALHESPDALDTQGLQEADQHLMAALAQTGFLTQMPEVWVTSTGMAAETDIVPGLQAQTTIVTHSDPTKALVMPGLDASHVDPVLLRWLVLFHEAAHTERGQMTDPILVTGQSAQAIRALNSLVWESGDFAGPGREVFDETFADLYAAGMLLQVTRGSPQAVAAIRYLRDFRLAEQTRSKTHAGASEGHGAGDALGQVLASFRQTPSLWTRAKPASLQLRTRRMAGDVMVAWWKQSGEAVNWAKTGKPGDNHELGWLRASDYLRLRIMSYVLNSDSRTPKGLEAEAGDSPLLQALAGQDEDLRDSFFREVSPDDIRALRLFARRHTPGGVLQEDGTPNPLSDRPGFDAWVETTLQRFDRKAGTVWEDDQTALSRHRKTLTPLLGLR